MVQKRLYSFCVGIVIWSLLVTTIMAPVGSVYAQTTQSPTDIIKEAEQLYTIGRFDEAIKMLTELLERKDISEDQKLRAYRLLGLSYIAKDFLEDARSAIRKLLDMVPDYMSDPVQDPPPFTRMVEEVKQIREEELDDELLPLIPEQKKNNKTMWMVIGGSVVAVGVLVAVLVSGGGNGGETNPLPEPPDLP
jgi:tetratricopeptide (TPR) repeat protein